MSVGGVFMLRECPNLLGNAMYLNNCNEFVRFEIYPQLLSEVITYTVTFHHCMSIMDYYKREKSARFEVKYLTTTLQFKCNEYQLMSNIINLQGIQDFENFLWTNIRSYYSEVYNARQLNQPCMFEIGQNQGQQAIFDINDGREVLGDDVLQYLRIFGNDNRCIHEQQLMIKSLIVKAY